MTGVARSRWARWSGATVAAILLVSACGGGGDDDATPSTGASQTTTSSADPATSADTQRATRRRPTSTDADSTSSSTDKERRRHRRTTTTSTLPVLGVPVAPPPPGVTEPEKVLGTIEIPKIEVTKYLFEGIAMSTLDKGPGHWPGTASPGQWGQMVVAGHRTSHDRPFRRLDELVPGDEIVITTPEDRFVYLVDRTQVVTPDAMWITHQLYDHTIVLFACHPPGSTAYRIAVFGRLQDAPPPIELFPAPTEPDGSATMPDP